MIKKIKTDYFVQIPHEKIFVWVFWRPSDMRRLLHFVMLAGSAQAVPHHQEWLVGILWSSALSNEKAEQLAIGQSEARKGSVMSAECAQFSSTAGTATDAASYCLPCTGFTFLQDTRSFQHTHTVMLFRSKLSQVIIMWPLSWLYNNSELHNQLLTIGKPRNSLYNCWNE